MSGICGIFNLDGAPVRPEDLRAVTAKLERRGPDRTSYWCEGPIGFGHTLLATTPELAREPQPVFHPESGCAITADIRLDNREELLRALGLLHREEELGDAGLVLEAYLEWGESCTTRFLGDFAFAIWDARTQKLFLGRDHFGMKPLYYHLTPGKYFIFASEADAILADSRVPRMLNDARIADFILIHLEWVDHVSTFYNAIQRVAPAHQVTVLSEKAVGVAAYWRPEPQTELKLKSDAEYEQTFQELMAEAVRVRVRGCVATIGSMLSGGLDSSTVAMFASHELGGQSLQVFSAVDASRAPESEAHGARLNAKAGNFSPTFVSYEDSDARRPDLTDLSGRFLEPFDSRMVLLAAIYEAAADAGVRVVLDGIAADNVLGERNYYPWLFRSGCVLPAVSGVWARNRFVDHKQDPIIDVLRLVFHGSLPLSFLRWMTDLRQKQRDYAWVRESTIRKDFAKSVSVMERFRTLSETFRNPYARSFFSDRIADLQAQVGSGIDRYGRTAALFAVEPRSPFLDLRLINFCMALPGNQLIRDGMPKSILRRVMKGRLPDEVLSLRARRYHLSGEFNWAQLEQEFMTRGKPSDDDFARVSRYIDLGRLKQRPMRDWADALYLSEWLRVRGQ